MFRITIKDDKALAVLRDEYLCDSYSNILAEKYAKKALTKYLDLVLDLLAEACFNGGYRPAFPLYKVPLDLLAKKGPRITRRDIRVHSLLNAKDLAPLKVFEKGSNIGPPKSFVLLNRNYYEIKCVNFADQMGDDKLIDLIPDGYKESALDRLPKELQGNIGSKNVPKGYSATEVSLEGLESLICMCLPLSSQCQKISKVELKKLLATSYIYIIASHFGGRLLYKLEKREFGRRYEIGHGLQNAPKYIRKAALSPAYEYDLGSSIFAWRLKMALQFGLFKNDPASIQRVFPVTYRFIREKKQFIEDICQELWEAGEEEHSREKIKGAVKKALTALTNGARLRGKPYVDADELVVPAIPKCFFGDDRLINAFQKNAIVFALQEESKVISGHIKTYWKKDGGNMFPMVPDGINNAKGDPKIAKVNTLMYQHFETELMDRFAAILEGQYDNTILVRIHDALIVRDQISESSLDNIKTRLEREFMMPLLVINETVL